ncbi:Hypothetical protein FKW44_016179 [Caligus rogercresseyi]|uniref:Uncharacterized protein n=1 Tax=Caligus rogercresseyi TaxID=217165 RepID=A0A7T8H1H3_CALRO|nr:Hypothetical protein FKW44_016179 [Caligus rogercresseyi]
MWSKASVLGKSQKVLLSGMNPTKSRSITVELKGIRKNRVLTKGTPQGGVLSPIA